MANPPPPPPPPEDPFLAGGDNGDPFGNGSDQQGMMQGGPSVAAKPGRVLVVLGFVGLILALLAYLIFSGGEKKVEEKPVVVTPAPTPIEPPKLPDINKTVAPPVFTPPVVPLPKPVEAPKLDPEEDAAAQKARLARLKSSMIIGGSGGINLPTTTDSSNPPNADQNSAFESAIVKSNTKADKVQATHIGNLRRTIAQGRLIHATMESVINTELPAPIRAIVSRDTYGESGTVPLIPKGSRLIGRYNTAIGAGQSRVFIVWTRVIRPDGVDVMINSPGVDQIGQAGAAGQVDSKFQEIFSRSVLASIVSIGFAMGQSEIQPGGATTTNTDQGSTTTGDAATTATVNALNRLGATTDSFLQRLIGVPPSILVDQGTVINVFVNRDLIFPAELVGTQIVE